MPIGAFIARASDFIRHALGGEIGTPLTPQPELRTVAEAEAEIAGIRAQMDAHELVLVELLPLTIHDCQVIGLIVQTFAYCDLNARRALEIIDHLEGSPPQAPNKALRDSEILPRLAERSTKLPISADEHRELLVAIEMLVRFVQVRHHLAHWAARRHPVHDALIAMTFNSREAKRRANHDPEPFRATYAVIPMPEVRGNLPVMQQNADYIASRVHDWWIRFMPPE